MNGERASSLASLVLNGIVLFLSLLVINIYALDLIGVALNGVWPPLVSLAEMAITVAIARPRLRRPLDWGEAAGALATFAGVFAFFLIPSLPSLYPPSSSVDAVHQYNFANYIFKSLALPHDVVKLSPYLGEYAVYPFGPAGILAVFSHALRQPPLVAMHPFMSIVRGLTAVYVFLIAYRLLPARRGRTLLALSAPVLLFAPATYFVGALIGEQYYFTQVFAELLLLAALYHLAAYGSGAGRGSLVAALVVTLAFVLTYPTWLGVPLLGFALAWLVRQQSWRQRVADALLFVAPVAILSVVYLPPRLSIGSDILRHPGVAAAPSVAILAWPFLILGLGGLLYALRQPRRSFAALVVVATIAAQTLALCVAVYALHLFDAYHVYKSFYLLVYPLAMLAPLALWALAEGLLHGRRQLVAGAAALALAGVIGVVSLRSAQHITPIQVITPDEVAVGEWVRDNLDVTQVGYRTYYGITAYWLHVALLGNSRESFITDSWLLLLPMTFREWLQSGTWPTYMIVDDPSEIPDDPAISRLHQQGDITVLAKPPVVAQKVAIGQPVKANIGGLVEVAGYTVPTARIVPGQIFDINVHWYVTHWPRQPVPVYLYAHLVDGAGVAWGKLDKEPLDGYYGSMRWPVGVVNTDSFAIPVPASAPPGRYMVQVGMYAGDGSGDMAITEDDGKPLDRLLMGPFKVALPPTQAQPSHEMARSFGGSIALIGYDLDAETVGSGDAVVVRLYWQDIKPVAEDYTYFVHVLDADGKLVAQCDTQPRGGAYPTSIWDKGEVVPDECRIQLPSLAPGAYVLKAGLYRWPSLQRLPADGGGDSVELGMITVGAR